MMKEFIHLFTKVYCLHTGNKSSITPAYTHNKLNLIYKQSTDADLVEILNREITGIWIALIV